MLATGMSKNRYLHRDHRLNEREKKKHRNTFKKRVIRLPQQNKKSVSWIVLTPLITWEKGHDESIFGP